jgi:hypothetical protein
MTVQYRKRTGRDGPLRCTVTGKLRFHSARAASAFDPKADAVIKCHYCGQYHVGYPGLFSRPPKGRLPT